MSFVPQITCRNCGTKYSALHGRCPNCGARRNPQTGDTPAPSRTVPPSRTAAPTRERSDARIPVAGAFKGEGRMQLIFGGALIVCVIVAVIILISASLAPRETEPLETPPPPVDVTTPPPTTAPPTPTPEPTVAVSSIIITYSGSPLAYDPFTQPRGTSIQLGATVYPTEALTDHTVEWRSTNEAVCTVDQTGKVSAVGSGSCEIIAECGGVATRCGVRVP